jgi:hypothetical protein
MVFETDWFIAASPGFDWTCAVLQGARRIGAPRAGALIQGKNRPIGFMRNQYAWERNVRRVGAMRGTIRPGYWLWP